MRWLKSRAAFLGAAMNRGLRWAWGVTGHGLRLLALVALGFGFGAAGLLLHRSVWFLVAFAGLVLPVVFFEGAYRLWSEAVNAREATESRAEPDLQAALSGLLTEHATAHTRISEALGARRYPQGFTLVSDAYEKHKDTLLAHGLRAERAMCDDLAVRFDQLNCQVAGRKRRQVASEDNLAELLASLGEAKKTLQGRARER